MGSVAKNVGSANAFAMRSNRPFKLLAKSKAAQQAAYGKELDLQRTMPFKHGKTFAALTPSRRNPSKISCRINCVLLTVDICRS